MNRVDAHPTTLRGGGWFRIAWPLLLVLLSTGVSAQTGIWPIATLQPPGVDTEITALAAVALAGDIAVTAYTPSATIGYRVYLRKRIGQGWGAPELLVQGQPGDGGGIALDGDADRIVIGLPKAAARGRVDVYIRNGDAWSLEQSLSDPPDAGLGSAANFGRYVSLRHSLLVVSSGQLPFASQFDTYRYDVEASTWVIAGYSLANPLSGSMIAKSDGTRVATCINVNCIVKSRDSAGQWVSEGTVSGTGSFGIAGAWFFFQGSGELGAYFRNGSSWELRQQFGTSSGFAVSDGRLIMRGSGDSASLVRIYELKGSSGWQLAGESNASGIASDSRRLAIRGNLAIAGFQGYADDGQNWVTSGVVEGVVETSTQQFGEAVALANGNAWIGSPGYRGDFNSGAVWMQPLAGTVPTSPSFLDVPASPAQNLGFGRIVATDGVRVVAASQSTPLPFHPFKMAVYMAGAISPRVADLTIPAAQGSVWKVDAAIDGDTVAVVRSSNGFPPELFIYRDNGSGFLLTQTITLPTVSTNYGYGQNVEISGDWLLAGRLQYRLTPEVGFVEVADIAYPDGLALDFSRMAKNGNRLVVPSASLAGGGPIGRLFSFDAASGWSYSGDLNAGAFEGAFCYWPAISDVAIVCTRQSSTVMHVATPDSGGTNWVIAHSGPVPGAISGPASQAGVAIEGVRVLLGVRAEPKVLVLSVTEDIFRSGFQ